MSATLCPHCDVALTQREWSEGWCDACGKKLPELVRRGEPQRNQLAKTTPARRRGFWLTFLLLLPCMVVGAVVALAVTGGKTSGGFSGITAAVGMGLGYAFRILPNKSDNASATAVS